MSKTDVFIRLSKPKKQYGPQEESTKARRGKNLLLKIPKVSLPNRSLSKERKLVEPPIEKEETEDNMYDLENARIMQAKEKMRTAHSNKRRSTHSSIKNLSSGYSQKREVNMTEMNIKNN